MCGIMGYTGSKKCRKDALLARAVRPSNTVATTRAGMATRPRPGGEVQCELKCRRQGVGALAEKAGTAAENGSGSCGIGHTRWATHGAPTESKRPPARLTHSLTLVHNGILDNFALDHKSKCSAERLCFCQRDQTPSASLTSSDREYRRAGRARRRRCMRRAQRLRGSYALAVTVSTTCPDVVYAVRQDSPLDTRPSADGERLCRVGRSRACSPYYTRACYARRRGRGVLPH